MRFRWRTYLALQSTFLHLREVHQPFMYLILCIFAYASLFIAHSLIVTFSIDCLPLSALLQWCNDQSPSIKSPSQAPTASPITPDPTKASNVTILCCMIQGGSSYPRRLWTLVSSYFSCIFWLLSVSLLLLSHYLSIYLSTQQRTTNIRHQHLLLPQVIRRLWVF